MPLSSCAAGNRSQGMTLFLRHCLNSLYKSILEAKMSTHLDDFERLSGNKRNEYSRKHCWRRSLTCALLCKSKKLFALGGQCTVYKTASGGLPAFRLH